MIRLTLPRKPELVLLFVALFPSVTVAMAEPATEAAAPQAGAVQAVAASSDSQTAQPASAPTASAPSATPTTAAATDTGASSLLPLDQMSFDPDELTRLRDPFQRVEAEASAAAAIARTELE